MPPVDRRNPIRAASSDSTCSLLEFARRFPDDEACLQHVWRERYSPDGEHSHCQRCERDRVFKRYETAQKRPCWFCQACGFRIHPLKGTIFERSSTSLQLWFYAIYMITNTRCGVSAKALERELGVTYKTAWRMFNLIRNELMRDESTDRLAGAVEADETQIAGRIRNAERRKRDALGIHKRSWAYQHAAKVFAVVERDGRVRATVIPDSRRQTLEASVRDNVEVGSTLYTDEYFAYERLGGEYEHLTIRHRDRSYAVGLVHTQTVEGFFGLLKNGIRATHHGVSLKWLQGYCNEYAWRWNRRDNGRSMFHDLLATAMTA
jgi:transposase